MKRVLPFLIILAVLGVAVGAGVYLKNKSAPSYASIPAQPNANPNNAAGGSGELLPAVAVTEPGAEPPQAVGPADAPVTLEEFGDFECPPCGMLHPELKKIEQEYSS